MNKKFIKVSLIICVSLIILLGIFSIGSKSESYFDKIENYIEIIYKDCKEEKYNYVVTVTVKNNSKDIASLSDMELTFGYNYNTLDSDQVGDFYIKGEEEGIWDDNRVMGIDPGKEKNINFKIPKGIEINKEYFNIKSISINYKADFFKFRTSKTSLFLGLCSTGGTKTLGKEY